MAIEQNIYLTVDAVVFHQEPSDEYEVLLIKRGHDPYKDHWALPGGFVEDGEDLQPAAARELEEETGIKAENWQQLYTVGTPDRDPRFRTVSVVYTCFADRHTQQAIGGDDAKEAKWFSINNLPPLAFDHSDVMQNALEWLKKSHIS